MIDFSRKIDWEKVDIPPGRSLKAVTCMVDVAKRDVKKYTGGGETASKAVKETKAVTGGNKRKRGKDLNTLVDEKQLNPPKRRKKEEKGGSSEKRNNNSKINGKAESMGEIQDEIMDEIMEDDMEDDKDESRYEGDDEDDGGEDKEQQQVTEELETDSQATIDDPSMLYD